MARLPFSISSSVRGDAPLFCSACGGDRTGELLGGRRWIRLGAVAVLPWRRTSPHVRCTGCGTVHPIDALDALTSAALATRYVDVTRIATAMIVRTGDPAHPDLRRRAVQHVRTVLPTYDQHQLDRDMNELEPALIADPVAPLSDALAVEGKERLVAGMVQVALAAHTITPHQRWLLGATGSALGLTPLHVTGIISGVAAAVEPATDRPLDQP
jgi:hypothetical protein